MRDLVCLHETLESSEDIWDCMMAGAALFCIYSRARWSDFVHCGKLKLDRFSDGTMAYVDADVAIHKTMACSCQEVPIFEFDRASFGSAWFRVGFKVDFNNGTIRHRPLVQMIATCLMPAPDSEGRPLVRAIESDEAGCWLRLLVKRKLDTTV